MSFYASLGRSFPKFTFLIALIVGALSTGSIPGTPFGLPPAQAQAPPTEDTIRSWQPLTSRAGNFSVSMPSSPAAFAFLPAGELSVAGLPVGEQDRGALMYLQMQLVDATRLEIYAVASTTAADFIEPGDAPNESLLRCVSSLNNQSVQPVISTVRLGEEIGIEAESFSPNAGLQVSRCYLTSDRAYMISVTSRPFQAGPGLRPMENNNLPVGTRSRTMMTFLNSFEILE